MAACHEEPRVTRAFFWNCWIFQWYCGKNCIKGPICVKKGENSYNEIHFIVFLLLSLKISTNVGILVTPWRTIFWRRSKQRSPWGRQAEQQAMGTVSKRDPGFRFNGKSFPSCIQWTSLLHLDIRVAFNIKNHKITTGYPKLDISKINPYFMKYCNFFHENIDIDDMNCMSEHSNFISFPKRCITLL